ncbi:MAG: CPBP family intramembrane glutamic endopeptidase [Solirubrobacterales bacterium]
MTELPDSRDSRGSPEQADLPAAGSGGAPEHDGPPSARLGVEKTTPVPPGPPPGWGGAKGIAPGNWGINGVILGIFVALFATVILGAFVVAIGGGDDSEGVRLASQAALAVSLIGVAIGFAIYSGSRPPLASLGFRRVGWGAVGLAFAAWLGYIIVAAQIARLLAPEQEDVTRSLGVDESTIGLVIAGILIVVLAPLSEEIFFRGFMFAGLRRRMTLWPAAAISAVIWGALHLTGGNLGVAALLTVFGLLLAWLYEHTGSLWPPIIAHAFNNALAFTVLVADLG